MRRDLTVVSFCLLVAAPASALDIPARKPGLWELKMEFADRKMPAQAMPAQVMKHCVDAATDKLMNSQLGGASQEACSKNETTRSGATIMIDSVCKFGDVTSTTHAVVTGSFDSAYTVDVTSTHEGRRPLPGMPPDGASHMTIAAKWLGPCEAGQKPGDIIMANGMKINVLELPRPPARKP